MNLEFLLTKFKERLANFEQAVQAHDANPEWRHPHSLHVRAEELGFELKWIARLSKRCPTLQAHYPE